jgi:predicted DNA-binding transcriptional regulator YafY
MARSDRLFVLLQALRTLPAPVTAERLAQETGVSIRSIYRDIESLRVAGAEIGGERGYGYCLIEDGTLPPQVFSRIEIEALVLGLGEVRQMGDPALADAAAAVLGKVAATLPSKSQQHLLHAVSQVRRSDDERYRALPDMRVIREGCWREEALTIAYSDKGGAHTERMIWPLAIVYLKNVLTVLAWCCLREDLRMFRADRITSVEGTGLSFRPRRVALLRRFLAELNDPEFSPDNSSGATRSPH